MSSGMSNRRSPCITIRSTSAGHFLPRSQEWAASGWPTSSAISERVRCSRYTLRRHSDFWSLRMSDHLNHGHSGHGVEYEPQDLSSRGVFGFFIGLAVTGVIIYFIITAVYSFLDKH